MMPVEHPKKEMPPGNYNPISCKDSIAMMNVQPSGLFVLYTELDQVRYATWDEIVEMVLDAHLKKPDPDPSAKAREIAKPDKPQK
jgi:hypothetical protein